MIIVITIAIITIIASIVLIYFFGYWGVLVATLISGVVGTFLTTALSGFGNPNGNVTKYEGLDYILTAIPFLIGGFIISYGIYYSKALITKESTPNLLTIIWACSLLLLFTFYAGRKLIKHITEREIYIVLGYDKELDLRWDDVTVSVTNGKKSEKIVLYGKGGLGKKNQYGYSSYISSDKKLYFKPQEIQIKILQKNKIPISLPAGTEDIRMYVNKDFYLKIFVNEELLSSHQLK